jgi:hypothetical protein
MVDSGYWAYFPDHGQICQVIEAQTLWGETTCRVWLPGRDSLVRIPASRLKSLESAGTGSPDDIAYVAAAARIGLPQVRDYRLNLLAQEERSFQEQLDQKAHAYPEMVPLLVIQVEGSIC